ncbi:hypothetical protein MIMGU_mgv1a017918mg, partial [Erythranthe guttata]
MDRISELPKHILQRILYFLSQKDAVRTSVLSKSWSYIWCTRPNLVSSYNDSKENKQEFLTTVEQNLQRYCDQRMCLEEFSLLIILDNHEYVSLLEKWIPTLKNMGVKKFRLSIYWKYSRQLPSVVFEAESLQDLHMEGFTLDQTTIGRNVLSKHLKRLLLVKVEIEDGVFQKIISSCPLIETLSLESCERLRNIKVNNLLRLKKFHFSSTPKEECCIEIYPASLEIINIGHADVSFPKGAEFQNLKSLFLNHVILTSFDNFSSCKFPSLVNLCISHCDGLDESTEESHLFLDAPNLNTFVYHGWFNLSFSIATTSREWSSTLYLLMRDDPSLWLLKLRKLLESLSRSKISLTIFQFHINAEDIFIENRDL